MTIKKDINMVNVSRKSYWAAIKNYAVFIKLMRIKKYRFGYMMPYGGTHDCNNYNFYSIEYTKPTSR